MAGSRKSDKPRQVKAAPVSLERVQQLALQGHRRAAEVELLPLAIFHQALLPIMLAQGLRSHEVERLMRQISTPHGRWILRQLYNQGLSEKILAGEGASRPFPETPTASQIARLLADALGVGLPQNKSALSDRERGCVERAIKASRQLGLLTVTKIPKQRGKSVEATPRLMQIMTEIGLILHGMTSVEKGDVTLTKTSSTKARSGEVG